VSESQNYFRIHITNVPRALEDLISSFCFENGALGVSEQMPFRQNLDDYSVETLPADLAQLDVFFSSRPPPEFMESLRAKWPMAQVVLSKEPHKDWLEEWKKGFVPFVLAGDVWIVPSWLTAPAQARKVIWMEPGMAFGTGTHATTRLASRLLTLALEGMPNSSVLDVGTGTGILAILAHHLGADSVVGTEIDSEARRVARENLELNHIRNIRICDEPTDAIESKFDVVVANIIDGVLVQMQSTFLSRTRSGGQLVLSGILDEREAHFKSQWNWSPWRILDRVEDEEWVGFRLEKR